MADHCQHHQGTLSKGMTDFFPLGASQDQSAWGFTHSSESSSTTPQVSGSKSAANELQTWKEWESVRRRCTNDSTRNSAAAGLNRLHSA